MNLTDKVLPRNILRIAAAGYFALIAAALCCGCKSEDRTVSHNITGVTARFQIDTPIVHFGQALRVTAFYRNETSHSVVFRFLPAIFAAKVWFNGAEELPCSYPDMGFTEVTLDAGQEIAVKDEMPFTAECHQTGPHEIRFYYHGSLLEDPKLEEMYLRKYPLGDRAIAWEDRGYEFTLKK